MRFEIEEFSCKECSDHIFRGKIRAKTDSGVYTLDSECRHSDYYDPQYEYEAKTENQGPHSINEDFIFGITGFNIKFILLSPDDESKKDKFEEHLKSINIGTKPKPKEAVEAILEAGINFSEFRDLDNIDLKKLEEKVWESNAFIWRYMFDFQKSNPDFTRFLWLLRKAMR